MPDRESGLGKAESRKGQPYSIKKESLWYQVSDKLEGKKMKLENEN